jgi:hypothetical protein
MPIIMLVVWLALIGLAVWLVTTYIPMPDAIKKLIVIAVVVLVVLWLIQLTGLATLGPAVPRLH